MKIVIKIKTIKSRKRIEKKYRFLLYKIRQKNNNLIKNNKKKIFV